MKMMKMVRFLTHNLEKVQEHELNTDNCLWANGDTSSLYSYDVALTGKAFNFMINQIKTEDNERMKNMYKAVIKHSKIFARMSSDDKAQLIIELQKNTQFMVGMCGDGAND